MATLLAAGCYDLSRTLPAADVAVPDSAAHEGIARTDVTRDGPLDTGPPTADGVPHDQWQQTQDTFIVPWLDAMPLPDKQVPDGAVPCVVPSEVNPNAAACNQQCTATGTKNDTDCDGLPGDRDPWATTCNKVTLVDDFVKDPVGSTTWDTPNGAGWSCGQVELSAGQSLKLKDLPPLAPARFLVEVKLTLGAIIAATKWGVRISSTPAAQTSLHVCEIWLNSSYGSTTGVHLSVGGCNGLVSPFSYPAAAGTTYYLQQYYDTSTQHCRLLDANGGLVVSRSLFRCTNPPQNTEALQVLAYGRAATIHHVRVFEAP